MFSKGCSRENGVRLFSEVHEERSRDNTQTETGKFQVDRRKKFTSTRASEHWHRFPREDGGISIPGDFQNVAG